MQTGGGVGAVPLLEHAPLEDADPHRREVAGSDPGDVRGGPLAGRGLRPALHAERALPAAEERQRGRRLQDAGPGPELLHDALDDRGALRVLPVGRLGQGHLGHHDAVGPEARVGLQHAQEAAEEEAGADQEDEGHRHLGDDQRVAHAVVAGPDAAAPGLLERLVQPGRERTPGGDEAERDSGHHGHHGGEGEDGRVDADLVGSRDVGGERGEQGLQAEVGQADPGERAQHREENALRQELAQQAPPRRAQGEADRDLPLPVGGPGQQEVGDVGAGDQEDEGDRPEQQHQRRPQLAHDRVEERLEGHALLRVRVRVALGEALREGLHLGAGAGDVHSRLQPADHVDPRVVAPLRLAPDPVLETEERREDVGGLPAPVEIPRHDADHREALPAQDEGAAEDAGVAAESPLPESLAQEDDAVGARLLLLRAERPAEDRSLPERRERPRRDLPPVDALGLAHGVRRPAHGAEDEVLPVVAGDGLEDRALVAQVLEVRHGEAHLRDLLRPLGEEHEAPGLRVRQGPQQDGVHHAEDRGVGADAERERGHGDDGEAGRAPQRAHREANVPPEVVHRLTSSRLSWGILPEL